MPIKYKIFLPQQVKLREEITNSKLIIPRTCLIDNEVDKVKYLDYLKKFIVSKYRSYWKNNVYVYTNFKYKRKNIN